jgi:predicted DNA binding CopG/RHH family protein
MREVMNSFKKVSALHIPTANSIKTLVQTSMLKIIKTKMAKTGVSWWTKLEKYK